MLSRLKPILYLYLLSMPLTGVTAEAQPSAADAQPVATAPAEPAAEKTSIWKGEAELGFVSATGNTDTQSTNAKFSVENDRIYWNHLLQLQALRAKDRDSITADRIEAFYRSLYKVSKKDYIFGSLKYEDDRFSGYDQRTTEIVGYGRKFYDREIFKLDAEIGIGARQADLTDNTQTDEVIVRLGSHAFWALSKTSSYKQEVFIERGDENTFSESSSELKVRINASLALKLSLSIKHNSDVPATKKKTDTLTAVTLVYDF